MKIAPTTRENGKAGSGVLVSGGNVKRRSDLRLTDRRRRRAMFLILVLCLAVTYMSAALVWRERRACERAFRPAAETRGTHVFDAVARGRFGLGDNYVECLRLVVPVKPPVSPTRYIRTRDDFMERIGD